MLFKVGVVLVIIATVHKFQVIAGDEKGLLACKEVFQPQNIKKQCCDVGPIGHMMPADQQKMHACPHHPGPGEEWTCEHAECHLNAFGILEDEKINYDAMKAHHEEFFKDNPDMKQMMEEVHKGCSEENLKAFPDHMCLAQKFVVCVIAVGIMKCPNWKTDDDTCQEIAENFKLCNEAVKNMKQ